MAQKTSASKSVARISEGQLVAFDIIKSNSFRGIHADGVWGGATPRGLIALTFFSERFPIPTQVSHRLEAGRVGDEVKDMRVSRSAIVREAEVCVYMNLETAISFRTFLDDHIKKIQVARKRGQRENKSE